jgi:hypothetical protein
LLLLTFVLLASLASLLTPNTVYGTPPAPIRVEKIDHVVMPIYGGTILINDTITISSSTGNSTTDSFSIGFPLKYRMNLQSSVAYNTHDPSDELNVTLNTGLGVIGYYGVTVAFPREVSDLIHDGHSYTFTVVFILAGLIDSSTRSVNATTEYVFTADFPVYPSLSQDASLCNVTVLLPEDTRYDTSVFPFNATTKDGQYNLNHAIAPLRSFSHIFTQVSYTSSETDTFVLFSVNQLEREVTIDSTGQVSATDLFFLKSKTAFTVTSIKLQLPKDASSISAFDEQRKKISIELLDNETNTYDIPLNLPANQAKSLSFVYRLSGPNRLVEQSAHNTLHLNLLENLQMAPQLLTLKITFPEGAAIQAFPAQSFSIERNVFQDTLQLTAFNVTWLQNEEWSFTYKYSVFWASFRPTLWATALVIVGAIIALAWQRPKAPTPVSVVMVPRETLDDFVTTYEEKKKAVSELEQVKRKGRKGKISRRRYKVRKTTIENRLSALSKKLVDLRHEIMRGGAKYADVMRQLEVAETELDNIDADIRRIEIRFKRGEISAQTYRQLLEEDLKRRDRAKTTIDGLLLRLQE